MRLVIDARLYGLEHRGLGRYLLELIAQLSRLDKENNYQLLINPKACSQPQGLPPNFEIIPAPWRIYSLSEQVGLVGLLKRLKPDLVHFPHFTVPLYVPTPFIVTIHDLIIHRFPSERATTLPAPLYWLKLAAYRLVVRRAVARARFILTPSQATADEIMHYYPESGTKIKVVPLAPTAAITPAAIKLPPCYLLTVGATYPHKNLELVLRALKPIQIHRPDLKLIVVGRRDVFMDRLQAYAERLNLKGIIFWGEASPEELAALYSQTQAYLLPSLAEGFGLGGVEALQYGVPVIASDIPILRETLGSAAWYVDPADETALAQSILALLNNSGLRQNLVSQAPKVLAAYSWERTARATIKAYEQVLGN